MISTQWNDSPVRVLISSNGTKIVGDRVRIKEVIENLVINAVKFSMNQNEVTIEIGKRNEKNRIVFFVKDSGIGISPEYHDKVFGLFERLDTSIDGTGVGLAIVRRIIEVHGGKIWIESEGGCRGTTFCFNLPVMS